MVMSKTKENEMRKFLMVLVVGMCLMTSCKHSRDAERKAYEVGCAEAIRGVLAGFGMQAPEVKVVMICAVNAEEYINPPSHPILLPAPSATPAPSGK